MKDPTFATKFSTYFQLQFVIQNDKPNWKIFFVIEMYYLQLKTIKINKYKSKMILQLQTSTMCQHHNNSHFKPL
jgi:hypothetical protein